MDKENKTYYRPIQLLGFEILHNYNILIFLLIFIFYSLTLIGNATIIILVSSSPSLHHPMYFFLCNLSISDLILTTSIVPNMMYGVLKGGITMSIDACITQFQCFGIAIMSECLLLAAMSYDRYLAICNPLHYIHIMNKENCLRLVILCWFLSFAMSFVMMILVRKLNYCGPNIIYHFFCDFAPILQLSCSTTFKVELVQKFLACPITVIPLVFIIVTYTHIIITILRIPSNSGRQKAFSTCSSHLAVVGTFYGSLITLYVVPSNSKNTLNANKILSLLYTVITPLLNPIIYSLKNMEIRLALGKHISVWKRTYRR
ncbi:hypothetical protein GDO86_016407 [Hymenochirus boettgeri]|uniref:Olfactory receptor n=1 Tax=Hymenochirus boettgeri TaxID=247094 RepID=A0A8T2K302_9PIPI|nr:hypothetical protein GDO86_016407 [Hymenochirus boettgeri]